MTLARSPRCATRSPSSCATATRVAIEGFTHLISFAAGHEIIRQRRRDLTLARLTPDLIYDQMIAGGVASKLVFSWLGNPGVGGLGAIRRRIEGELPDQPLEIEEYSHFGMVGRYTAGAMNLPFFPLRSYFETDLPVANPLIRPIQSPYGDETIYAVPPLKPDVAIVHAQRASAAGDTQVWGLLGCQKEAAFAADRVIVVVEELVDEAVIRADPNRTIIPGLIVDAVVVEPWGAHPSYVQGAYDRDNRFYLDWDPITRDEDAVQAWLREWVYDLDGRAAYIEKLGAERLAGLARRPRRPARSTTGRTDERAPDDPHDRPVSIRDRRRPGADRRERRGDDPGLAAALPPGAFSGHGASGSRCRSSNRRSPRGTRATRTRRSPVTDATFSKSEMMIVAAARALEGQRVCFVGVGLPNIAVNLAQRTVAPELELVYEAGVFGARPSRLPLSHRRPDDRHRLDRRRQHARAVRLLPAGRPDRRRVPGRRPDRPLRQHQHDRHRRLRSAPRPACPAAAARARSRSTPARCS